MDIVMTISILSLLIFLGVFLDKYYREKTFVEVLQRHVGQIQDINKLQQEKISLLEELIVLQKKEIEILTEMNDVGKNRIDVLTNIIKVNEMR